jgi:hypothetical protein
MPRTEEVGGDNKVGVTNKPEGVAAAYGDAIGGAAVVTAGTVVVMPG